MFDILFGWRKASKCKKLIRRVQCRLKLLKNKRCSIIRQSRQDLAHLISNGHEHVAFNRVEQLFNDEKMVKTYDQLDHFCEFIIINLSYIRRHKDLPNDINEAVSSLMYASSRFGDLPELPLIRKLFGERYGQRFAMTALELQPGNLVNCQLRDNLAVKPISDDAKYRLLAEISMSCTQPEPLALEYSSEAQQMACQSSGDQADNGNTQFGETELQLSTITATERQIEYVDLPSENKQLVIEPFPSQQDSDTTFTSFSSSTVTNSSIGTVDSLMHNKQEKVEEYDSQNFLQHEFIENTRETFCSRGIHAAILGYKVVSAGSEYSSESSVQLPEDMIYLDDIEEIESTISRDWNCQDQRLFKFTSSIISMSGNFEIGSEGFKEHYELRNGMEGFKTYKKWRKDSGKRVRKRQLSWENRSSTDVDSAIYCGESCENSPNQKNKSHHLRKHHKKIPLEESRKFCCTHDRLHQLCCDKSGSNITLKECQCGQMLSSYNCNSKGEMVKNCTLEHPSYRCINDHGGSVENNTPCSAGNKITTSDLCHCQCYHRAKYVLLHQNPRRQQQNDAALCRHMYYTHQTRMQKDEISETEWETEGLHDPGGCAASVCSRVASPRARKSTPPPYSRAMTMPPERPKDDLSDDSILRSNSFPFQDSSHLISASSFSPHVHPKLPDYDKLAAKFIALKKVNLQNKHLPGCSKDN